MAPKKSKAEETAASSKKAAKPIAKAKGAAASKVSKSKPTPKTKAVAKPQPKASKKEKPVKKVAASKPTKVAPKPVKKAATPKPKKAATPKPKKGKKEDDEDSMEEDEFEVEEIRACKFDLGKKFYLIKWVVFDEDEKTWEPEENIFSKELITKYEERLNKTPVSLGLKSFYNSLSLSLSFFFSYWILIKSINRITPK
eukprot:TRINITY_DN4636_c0_g2_i4.p1 TRINITY_DN4636_c0_g2~~TRINITY_DN4636_c0_g2_i4.p1  ORF type:complete len:198 (-),score=52.22 TRINITY_DN4636_c0_g2_i4:151-744(-)